MFAWKETVCFVTMVREYRGETCELMECTESKGASHIVPVSGASQVPYFPGNEFTCQRREHKSWGFDPVSGRSTGERNGNLLHILAWEIPWTEELMGCSPGVRKELATSECTGTPLVLETRLQVPPLLCTWGLRNWTSVTHGRGQGFNAYLV